MQIVYKSLLAIHVISGTISLILFWIPAIAKKGKRLHNLVGTWYVWTMSLVLISALSLCLYHFFISGQYIMGLVLSFLSFLTLNPLWSGMDALRQKKGLSPSSRRMRLGLDLLLMFLGFILLIIGVYHAIVLVIIFGVVGSLSAIPVYQAVSRKQGKFNWYDNHRSQMIISGSAAYTAFFAFGARRFLVGLQGTHWMIIPWVAPTLLALAAIYRIRYVEKRARQKKARKKA